MFDDIITSVKCPICNSDNVKRMIISETVIEYDCFNCICYTVETVKKLDDRWKLIDRNTYTKGTRWIIGK